MMTLLPARTTADLVYDRIAKNLVDVGIDCYTGSSAPDGVEGTGTAFVALVNSQSGWNSPNFSPIVQRRIFVNIFADRSRTPFLLDDAESRAVGIFERIDPLLQRVSNADWPEVVACERVSAEFVPIPDGDGSVLLSVVYEVSTWQ